MREIPLRQLVLDMAVYPRDAIDEEHAMLLSEAIRSGAEMPPLVICKKSKRVVDGFHRHRGYTRVYGSDHEVKCVEVNYADDGQLFLDAVKFNASHGRNLSMGDRARCVEIGDRLGIDPELLTARLCVSPSVAAGLRSRVITGSPVRKSVLAAPATNGRRYHGNIGPATKNRIREKLPEPVAVPEKTGREREREWRMKVMQDCERVVKGLNEEDVELLEYAERVFRALQRFFE